MIPFKLFVQRSTGLSFSEILKLEKSGDLVIHDNCTCEVSLLFIAKYHDEYPLVLTSWINYLLLEQSPWDYWEENYADPVIEEQLWIYPNDNYTPKYVGTA